MSSFSLPPISPPVRALLGFVAALLVPLASSSLVQPPWSGLVALVAVACGLLGGAAVKVPAFLVGRPILRGSFPVALSPLVYFLAEHAVSAPDSLERGASLLVAVALSWLAGIPFPQPGQRPAADVSEVVANHASRTAESIGRTLSK